MDDECDFCGAVIKADKPRFYVAFSPFSDYREDWQVILTICPRCFAGDKFKEVEERR